MEKKLQKSRERRRTRIKKHILGTTEKPRMVVYRSLKQCYVQLIDDNNGRTLLSASTLSKEVQEQLKEAKGKIAKAKIVGKFLAQEAAKSGITTVIFDRNIYKFHGRVKAVAEGAKEGGIKV
ncbi:MAG: 50S ribosomal protein L18 [Ignavibacteriales bacterium]|nr:50S ribosomal protein L18 [Ignavibacteriales bacterium]